MYIYICMYRGLEGLGPWVSHPGPRRLPLTREPPSRPPLLSDVSQGEAQAVHARKGYAAASVFAQRAGDSKSPSLIYQCGSPLEIESQWSMILGYINPIMGYFGVQWSSRFGVLSSNPGPLFGVWTSS